MRVDDVTGAFSVSPPWGRMSSEAKSALSAARSRLAPLARDRWADHTAHHVRGRESASKCVAMMIWIAREMPHKKEKSVIDFFDAR